MRLQPILSFTALIFYVCLCCVGAVLHVHLGMLLTPEKGVKKFASHHEML